MRISPNSRLMGTIWQTTVNYGSYQATGVHKNKRESIVKAFELLYGQIPYSKMVEEDGEENIPLQ
jgi:hypothetical protein